MKIYSFIVLTFGFAALLSCKKNDSSGTVSALENKWRYADTIFKAAFSEINTRNGFQITFRPEGVAGLTHGISFQFLQRPLTNSSYTISKNLSNTNQIKIILEAGTTPYHYGINANTNVVNTTISDGKITISGNDIKAVRDTIPAYADTLHLSFNLTEF